MVSRPDPARCAMPYPFDRRRYGAAGRGGVALSPGLDPGKFLEVVNMTVNNTTIQWGKTHQNGPRKGAKSARNGRKVVSARQARLDGLATVLKGFIGSDNFVSVRDNGPVILFKENGTVIAKANGSQDFGSTAEASIKIVLEDGTEVPVTLAAMAKEQASVSSLEKGTKRKCWLVRTTGDDGRTTYRPAGVAYVDGRAMPVREGAARSFIAMQLAWAMTPAAAKKGGKRVKFNIHSKDGKGTRYTFRYNGADIAEFYHDGRFEDLGENAKPIEHYLAKAGIPCVDNSRLMAKLAGCMVSPRFESDIDESVEPYDNDDAHFAGVSETAVKCGLLREGQSIADFGVKVEKNKETRECQLVLFALPPKRAPVDRSKLVEPELDFGGDEPSEDDASPSQGPQAGCQSQSVSAAPAQVAVAPVAA